MLKLKNAPIDFGLRIVLPEEWHEKLINLTLHPWPYEYTVTNCVERFEPYYICVAENFKIALTESCIRYLTSDEVTNSSKGFYFDKYLPIEKTQIIVTHKRYSNRIALGTTTIKVEWTQIEKESLVLFAFYLSYLYGKNLSSLREFYVLDPYTWRFLLSDDETHMTADEKMVKDISIHKSYLQKSCNILAQYLESEGATYHADELRKRAIKLLQEPNSDYSETYVSPLDISKLDIMEMCCYWHAISIQSDTNFLEYAKGKLENSFHFPEWMFAEIWHYCEVLNSAP